MQEGDVSVQQANLGLKAAMIGLNLLLLVTGKNRHILYNIIKVYYGINVIGM